jgi:hypothetical protein
MRDQQRSLLFNQPVVVVVGRFVETSVPILDDVVVVVVVVVVVAPLVGTIIDYYVCMDGTLAVVVVPVGSIAAIVVALVIHRSILTNICI